MTLLDSWPWLVLMLLAVGSALYAFGVGDEEAPGSDGPPNDGGADP